MPRREREIPAYLQKRTPQSQSFSKYGLGPCTLEVFLSGLNTDAYGPLPRIQAYYIIIFRLGPGTLHLTSEQETGTHIPVGQPLSQ